ncbi:hypothetical protein B566_EDAN002151 [Ephemera danica]|nr:hypothetical protein B566_EDAN002151 [Ephemera danica]
MFRSAHGSFNIFSGKFMKPVMLARCGSENSEPHVTVRQGTLCGKLMRSLKGRNFYAFQGIPYAKPPVGPLRFKPPQEVETWDGILQAKKEGANCAQIDMFTKKFSGGEDCLYLNVYTPTLQNEGSGLSVMVWIHGGAFYSGSGKTDMYGPNFLLDHDTVLVTINYRLAIFGFLSLGTTEAPGNYGMKDQVAALRWVQQNIARFGGNPNCVTIFGESAGATRLFHRAMIQSGSAYDYWALQRNAATNAKNVAIRLGCEKTDPESILQFICQVEAQKLAEIDLTLRTEQYLVAGFTPSIEPPGTVSPFLTEDPHVILSRGDISRVPLMAGQNTREGMLALAILQKRKETDDLEAKLKRSLPDMFDLIGGDSKELDAISKRICDFYRQIEPNDVTEQYVLLQSDMSCTKGLDEFVRDVAALNHNPVFYFSFSYDGSLGLQREFNCALYSTGTCHMDELGYLFSRKLIPNELESASAKDLITIDRMTKLWVNFANTGNPTPDASLGVLWGHVTAPPRAPHLAHTRYLDIGDALTMKNENLNEKRVQFWRNLVAERQMRRGKL